MPLVKIVFVRNGETGKMKSIQSKKYNNKWKVFRNKKENENVRKTYQKNLL